MFEIWFMWAIIISTLGRNLSPRLSIFLKCWQVVALSFQHRFFHRLHLSLLLILDQDSLKFLPELEFEGIFSHSSLICTWGVLHLCLLVNHSLHLKLMERLNLLCEIDNLLGYIPSHLLLLIELIFCILANNKVS